MKESVNFENSQTIKNLARAFAGEVQDGARYQFLAEEAKNNGYFYLETICKTLAKNEMAHAKTLYGLITSSCTNSIDNIVINAGFPFKCGNVLDEVKHSLENEKSEAESVYLEFAKTAKDENFKEPEKIFNAMAEVENYHQAMLKEIYNKIKNNKLYKSSTEVNWRCSECGHSHKAKEAFKICPLCGKPQGYVEIKLECNK